jgi:ABC-2 type transport system permease protein
MSSPLRGLIALELRETARQPLTIAILLLLVAAMLVGALNGAARVDGELRTLADVAREEAASLRTAKAAAVAYSKPSDLKVDYHRDPTDAFGYMTYFLVTHAVKPPTPLAALAAGQSDLQPLQIRIDFNAIFPDAAYDPGNPHALELGSFDLAFVLVFLTPLGLIALGATRLTGEQDSGVLRLIAAQPVTLRAVAFSKYAALAIISVVAIVGGMLAASLVAGGVRSLGLVAIALMVALWALFWVALCAVVATFWRGAVASIAILVLAWAGITVLAPGVATFVIDLAHPAPSRIAYIDASRQAMDRFHGDETAAHSAWLRRRYPQLAASNPDVAKSPDVKRFARDAFYRDALRPRRAAFLAHGDDVLAWSDALRLISPAMMVDGALQTAAGADARRHQAFIAATDAYTEQLRRYFQPLALDNAANPIGACAQCPGRLNFLRYDEVPKFRPTVDERPGQRAVLTTCLYLGLLVGGLAAIAARRMRDWPA